MPRTYFIVLFSVLICCRVLNAQTDYERIGTSLENQFNKLAVSEDDTEKRVFNDSIIILIQQYIDKDSVFYHRFGNTKYLGQITSPDSLVKILTWNVALSEGMQNYYCYLLTRSSKKNRIISHELSVISGTDKIRKDTTYSQADWYGSLYYDIRPFQVNDEKYYILLGIDFKDIFLTRKVIDIVKLNDGNKLVFGKLCFDDGKKLSYREVFEYSSRASMTLRFNSDNEIIFDHLSPFSPEYKDNFQYYGPDFSYDSYAFEKGQWKLKQDIDIRNNE
jgi:hypothetical protein